MISVMKANLAFCAIFCVLVINSLGFESEPKTFEDDQALDCLGLGKETNQILEWFFKERPDKDVPVDFRFFSRNNRENVTIAQNEGFVVDDIDFDVRRRTVFIVHGFLSNGRVGWPMEMKDSFLDWDDLNIFVLDWGKEANEWNYLKAAVNTKTIAEQTTLLIHTMANVTMKSMPDYSQWGSIYCVGHSLGAHICGYVAKLLQQQNHPWRLTRITGLDPASPCFKHATDDLFLQDSDADFVDIIHTNGRNDTTFGLGIKNATGSVDFYPNGGGIQPGCKVEETELIWGVIPLPIGAIKNAICSHGRAYEYFMESIDNAISKDCSMYGYKWNMNKTRNDLEPILKKAMNGVPGCTELGINAENYSCRGTFFVVVGPDSPYCNITGLSGDDLLEIVNV